MARHHPGGEPQRASWPPARAYRLEEHVTVSHRRIGGCGSSLI